MSEDKARMAEILNGSALLPLLQHCTVEELDPLFKYLDQAGLGNALSVQDKVKQFKPDHTRYPELIDEELRCMGGNSFANVFLRGFNGPPYAEIVADVCAFHKVKVAVGDSVPAMEMALITKLGDEAFAQMSDEQKREFLRSLGDRAAGFDEGSLKSGVPLSVILAQLGVRMAGFAAYRMSLIVANLIARAILGQGLAFGVNTVLTRSIGIIAGPVGWAVSLAWLALSLAGPAYRVTVPCVVTIAAIRQQKLLELSEGRAAA